MYKEILICAYGGLLYDCNIGLQTMENQILCHISVLSIVL